MKENKITPDIIQKRKEMAKELALLDGKIVNRIGYIIKTIYSTFHRKLKYWYVEGAGENEIGDINKIICGDSIETWRLHIEPYHQENLIIFDRGNILQYLPDNIPIRWMYEDFENELISGKEKYEVREQEEKLKDKTKKELQKQKKAELIAIAKAKLSPEELKALRSK